MIILLADVPSVQSYFGSERTIRLTRQAWQLRKLKAWYPEELRAGHMINSQVGESETVYFRLFWQSISQITVFPTFCMWHFPISIPRRQRWLTWLSSALYIFRWPGWMNHSAVFVYFSVIGQLKQVEEWQKPAITWILFLSWQFSPNNGEQQISVCR